MCSNLLIQVVTVTAYAQILLNSVTLLVNLNLTFQNHLERAVNNCSYLRRCDREKVTSEGLTLEARRFLIS